MFVCIKAVTLVLDLKGLVFAFKPVILAFYVMKCFGAVESFEGCTVLGKKNHKDLVKPTEGYKTLLGLSVSFHRHRERPCDTLQLLFSVKGNT